MAAKSPAPAPSVFPQETRSTADRGVSFVPRGGGLREDIADGKWWRTCGVQDEYTELREVLLSWPSDALARKGDPQRYLMNAWPELPLLRRQTERIVQFFDEAGVTVHVDRPPESPPPNYLFMRDLFFMTPEGAILGRPAALARAGEERFAAAILAKLGIPVLRSVRGGGTFEGADGLWLDRKTVAVGVGQRTNEAGLAQVVAALAEQSVKVVSLRLPAGAQHLLGLVVPLAADLALVSELADRAAVDVLRRQGMEVELVPCDEEFSSRRGMNLVTLGPRRVVMPSGCLGIRRRLDALGVETHELAVTEYIKAAGALGCLTAILHRSASVEGAGPGAPEGGGMR